MVVIVDKRSSSEGHRLGGNQAMNMRVAKDLHHPAEGEVMSSQSNETHPEEDQAMIVLPLADKRASIEAM
jgi:hypothetical protein